MCVGSLSKESNQSKNQWHFFFCLVLSAVQSNLGLESTMSVGEWTEDRSQFHSRLPMKQKRSKANQIELEWLRVTEVNSTGMVTLISHISHAINDIRTILDTHEQYKKNKQTKK